MDGLKQFVGFYKDMNEIIVQEIHDTGACYMVLKCPEIVFKREKMVRKEKVPLLDEKMETMDLNQNL